MSRWRQIDALYHEALARPADERAAYVTEASAGDDALRDEVLSLLAEPSMPGFLSEPAIKVAAAQMESAHAAPWVGRRLGVYEIQTLIGEGGMGEVYRAHDTRLGRDVALKMLPRAFTADADRLARFEREARVLASLNHPHIGTIYGIEESDGVRALVLELVEGDTLADRIARGPLPIPEALTFARQIADALDAAHEKGVVHRDLKPANIKITPSGVVKVLDFGLAKSDAPAAADGDASPTVTADRTEAGAILGTTTYMSPEQARGQIVDKRTDVWAFGCVLYEMLTGRRAFRGATTSDTIAAILQHEPDWQALPAALPPAVLTLLVRCLEKDVRRRKRDVGDVRGDLEDMIARPSSPPQLSSNPPSSPLGPPSELPPAPAVVHERRRRPAGAMLGAVVLIGALGAGGWLWARPAPWQNPLANARFEQLTDFSGNETAPAISPDGRYVAYLGDRDGHYDMWLTQLGTGRSSNLTNGTVNAEPNCCAVPSLGFTGDGAEIWLSGFPNDERRLISLSPIAGPPRLFLNDRAMSVAWAPDGHRIVYQTYGPDELHVADPTGDNPDRIYGAPGPGVHHHGPIWSPDGQWIYFVSGYLDTDEMNAWRIRPSGTGIEALTEGFLGVASLTPLDERTVLFVARESDGAGPWLYALDPTTKVSRRISAGLERYTSIAASADGRRLVASVANPRASLWNVPLMDRVAGPADVRPHAVPSIRALVPRVRGTALYYLSSAGTGDGLWRLRDGVATEVWPGSRGALRHAPAIAPDGLRFAVLVGRNGKPTLTIVEADGGTSRSLDSSVAIGESLFDWSNDGLWIVAVATDGSRERGLFKIPVNGGAAVRLTSGEASDPIWSPTEDLIVYRGPSVGAVGSLLAVRSDGTEVPLPEIRVSTVAQGTGRGKFRFLPDGSGIVYLAGGVTARDFWLFDLGTKTSRQITNFASGDDAPQGDIGTFDITSDGRQIIFDRRSDNSDIRLIDLARD